MAPWAEKSPWYGIAIKDQLHIVAIAYSPQCSDGGCCIIVSSGQRSSYFFQERLIHILDPRPSIRLGAHRLWAPTIFGRNRCGLRGATTNTSPRSWPAHLTWFLYFLQFTRSRPANVGQDEEPGETIETTCAGERSLPNSSPRGCTGR
jgi:hypothetical protein